jgi:DNA-3-methyladenine glycosylase
MAELLCSRDFFEQPVDAVARELIGAFARVRFQAGSFDARIVETEAYGGFDDPASHAFRGPTPRSAIMFGPAGYLYVYRIYGIHWCMNVVTQDEGSPSAVLLRGAQIRMCADGDHSSVDPEVLARGPGNLTRALGITGADNGVDCCNANAKISFWRSLDPPEVHVNRSARVGVSRAKDRESRYFLAET